MTGTTLGHYRADAPIDSYRLSRDERFAYFPLSRDETDIWLVDLVPRQPGR